MAEQRLPYSVTDDRGVRQLYWGGAFRVLPWPGQPPDRVQGAPVRSRLRDLLTEALAAQRAGDPASPAAFCLASQPPS